MVRAIIRRRRLIHQVSAEKAGAMKAGPKTNMEYIDVPGTSIRASRIALGVAPLHTAQPPYNLFERSIEQDVLPYC
ncbi:aryl-alcohol dehydrogenase-like predicted oxidoreductase [Bradyrhizobium sp. F1.13.1]